MSLLPPIPGGEADRLARLRELVVLDSAPEALFDTIADLASTVCGAPIALLSLVDAERQWFKANVGLPGINETPRDVAFCAHAIASEQLFEVPDATHDPRFADNPMVTGAPDIRFYAGAALTVPTGERVGTLCVIDREPRRLDDAQATILKALASVASQALVMRRDLIDKSLSVRQEYEHALAESEARYRAIVEEQAEFVSLAEADGTLAYVNPAYARHFGKTPQQMLGRNLLDFVEPSDRDAVGALIRAVVMDGATISGKNRMKRADGATSWVEWTNTPQRDSKGRILLHSVGRDISADVHARHELLRQTATLRSVTEAIPSSVAVVGADGRYRFVNGAFEQWCGMPRERIVGKTAQEVMGEPESSRRDPWIERVLTGEAVTFDLKYDRGSEVTHLAINHVPLLLEDGESDGYVMVANDVTQHKQEEGRLLELSLRDPLTGLLNRAGFEQALEGNRPKGPQSSVAVLYIDLDHFKRVNDEHGHPVGDRVLELFARRLGALVRPTDAVARLGGDEFAIGLFGVGQSRNAHAVAEKVVAAAHATFLIGSLALHAGASVGVAFSADPNVSWRNLVALADAQLLKAKSAGKGRQASCLPA